MRSIGIGLFVLATSTGCRSVVLSEYGTNVAVTRNDDGSARGRDHRHRGVDFRAAVGEPAIAATDGRVISIKRDDCAGYYVMVKHPGLDRATSYVHLQSVGVARGDTVQRGQPLGEVGLFPCSGGIAHVHMELLNLSRAPGMTDPSDDLRGTEDPLRSSAGCFDPAKRYSPVQLTYPVRC